MPDGRRSSDDNQHTEIMAVTSVALGSVPLSSIAGFYAYQSGESTDEHVGLIAGIFSTASDAIVIADLDHKVLAVNTAFTQMTGYLPTAVIGRTTMFFRSDRHDAAFYNAIWASVSDNGGWHGQVWSRRRDGGQYLASVAIFPLRGQDGQPKKYVGILRDAGAQAMPTKQFWHNANYDQLTGLPNRALFLDRLECAILDARRERTGLALLVVDLDKFMGVNETLGHDLGDRVLEQASHRLRLAVRESDAVARLGADEFAIILRGIQDSGSVGGVAEKLIQAFRPPFMIGDFDVTQALSIGITVFPDDGQDQVSLLKNAEMALHRVKDGGGNAFAFFTDEMSSTLRNRITREKELRHAIRNGELVVHYQPLVNAVTLKVEEAEALVRWQHPTKGLIPPSEFIALAEEINVIGEMSEWVLHQACKDARRWYDMLPAAPGIAVNMSNRQMRADLVDFDKKVAAILAETGLPPSFVKFEITESCLMEDIDVALPWLQSMRERGHQVAIDDFGTGYSSLNYLRRLPIDVVKIDRSFVADMVANRDGAGLVQAIIAMAHSLRKKTVAEGVETGEQLTMLRAAGCDLVQGYYFRKPLPAAEFEDYLLSTLEAEAS
jgi:diguanylate cyclase (GGDEF)-like protein/PAS domain S-box-containing protein